MLPVLTVEITPLVLVLTQITTTSLDSRVLLLTVVLCGVGTVHTEIAVRVESVRRRVTTDTAHVDLCSVWTFAAAIVLPPALAALVAVIVSAHQWWRSYRPRTPLYRQVFTTSTIVLAALAASAVMAAVADSSRLAAIVLAVLAYTTVNSCLVAGAIAVSTAKPDLAAAFGDWESNVLEIASLSLGALTALALLINPWLVLFVLPPVLVLHRAVLVRQLAEAARTDLKTGLLNAAAWHSQAERALDRSRHDNAPRGVLVLDLDHFKKVNDTYGHLAGDKVLAAVADALRGEVRDRDLVGRFGGEEFVVLLAELPGGAAAELEAVAERMRRRVERLRVEIPTPDGPLTVAGLTVSIGAAVHPGGAQDLRTLLQIADTAVYTAKRDGRNRVRMGRSVGNSGLPRHLVGSEPPAAAR
jgi:diguanylate cyclase (GGDEF)-like protein